MAFSNARPIVSIIIVTWNSAVYLPRCLESLCVQTFTDFEIQVIDNGSTDGCVSDLPARYPQLNLRLEQLSSNTGFAVANNIGARMAHGKWIVLLNADAFPDSGWLEALVNAAHEHSEFSSFSSRLLNASDPRFLDGAGDAYHVSGLAWKRYIGYPSEGYALETREVFSPCAAAALYDREAFLAVGGFDEDYFSYFEDVDLGFRMRVFGYRSLYVAKAIVHHVGSASLGRGSSFAFYHSHRNLVWTFVKNMPASLFWKYLPAHILANLIYLTYYSLRIPGAALWRGKKDALLGLQGALRKRRYIQDHCRVSPSQIERVMDHGLFKPYLLDVNLRRARHASGAAKKD